MKSIIYLLWMELKMFAKRNVVTSKPALYNFFQDCSLVKMVNLLNEAVVDMSTGAAATAAGTTTFTIATTIDTTLHDDVFVSTARRDAAIRIAWPRR